MRMKLFTMVVLFLVLACSGNGGNGNGDPDGSTSCTPLTPDGNCNIFEQCGCEGDDWCTLAFDDLTCTFFEDCAAPPTGGEGPESQCYETFPELRECRPGSDCFWVEEMYSNRCRQWCLTDEDCTAEGRTCTDTISIRTMHCTSAVTAPFNACTISF